jgi:hypothetical protein
MVYLIVKLRFHNILSEEIRNALKNNLGFPYLQEEVGIILYSFYKSQFIFIKLKDLMYTYKRWRIIYFSMHFTIFYGIRIITLSLFFNFVFLQGDLRYIIYLAPINFIGWVLRFFTYFFRDIFIPSNKEYLNKILKIVWTKPEQQRILPLLIDSNNMVQLQKRNLKFTLMDYGRSEGFDKAHSRFQNDVVMEWFVLSNLTGILKKYESNRILYYLKIFLLGAQIFLWGSVVYFYFSPIFDSETTSLVFGKYLSGVYTPVRHFKVASYIHPAKEKQFEQISEGIFKAKHMVCHDTDNIAPDGSTPVEGSLTSTPPQNFRAYLLHHARNIRLNNSFNTNKTLL